MRIVTVIIMLIIRVVYAQDTTFFAKNKKVNTLDSCERYRVVKWDTARQLYSAKYYSYKSPLSIVESEKTYIDKGLTKLEGESKSYFPDGRIASKANYVNGETHGYSVSYYNNGNIFWEVSYLYGMRDGSFRMYYPNGNIKRDENYSANKWINGKMYDSTGIEIPYCGEFEQQPQYPGGVQAFYKQLSKNIKFPKSLAKDRKFKGGKVFTTFIVDSDGSIKDVEIIKGLHPDCDEEALRVILSMPKWIPGFQDCKPVRVKYNVPISFLIE